MSLPDPAVARARLLAAARACGALKFGRFVLRSGRDSPYFFDIGSFCDAHGMALLGSCYAAVIAAAMRRRELQFDVLFGPAYKGIPLAVSVALSLHRELALNCGWACDRKERKSHGEAGLTIGAPLAGKRVLLVDDVLSAGSAARATVELLQREGARPVGLAVALDRREKGRGGGCAAAELAAELGLTICSIATVEQLLEQARAEGLSAELLRDFAAYRAEYGA